MSAVNSYKLKYNDRNGSCYQNQFQSCSYVGQFKIQVELHVPKVKTWHTYGCVCKID